MALQIMGRHLAIVTPCIPQGHDSHRDERKLAACFCWPWSLHALLCHSHHCKVRAAIEVFGVAIAQRDLKAPLVCVWVRQLS